MFKHPNGASSPLGQEWIACWMTPWSGVVNWSPFETPKPLPRVMLACWVMIPSHKSARFIHVSSCLPSIQLHSAGFLFWPWHLRDTLAVAVLSPALAAVHLKLKGRHTLPTIIRSLSGVPLRLGTGLFSLYKHARMHHMTLHLELFSHYVGLLHTTYIHGLSRCVVLRW